jgi:trimeric autotransporter adhesin
MKFHIGCVVLGFLSLVLSMAGQTSGTATSTDQLPRLMKFTGTLQDANGSALTGIVGVTFALYSESSGGAPLWLETQNVQPNNSGHYTVLLGSTKAEGLPLDLFVSEQARWLGVQTEGHAEQPRVLLVAVPYALKAHDAETVGGLPPSAFMLAAPAAGSAASSGNNVATPASAVSLTASNVTTTGGTVNTLPLWTTATNIQSSVVTQTGSGSTAKIGIGTSSPMVTLDVKGAENVGGTLTHSAAGTATSTKGYNSQADLMIASVFNSGTGKAVNQKFQLQAEPVNNDKSTASGTLNLLYGSGTATPTETGLKISPNGQITFAAGQTFPGTGTVTSVGLAAPSSDFTVSGSPVTGAGTLSLGWTVAPSSTNTANAIVKRDGSGNFSAGTVTASAFSGGGSGLTSVNAAQLGGLLPGAYAQLAAANAFTASQQVKGYTLSMTIGDVGCGSGENQLGSAGIDTSGTLNCTGYSLLGDGKTTFINRPSGGAIKFRENNSDEMVIISGGNVGIGMNNPTDALGVVAHSLSGRAISATGFSPAPGSSQDGGSGLVGFGGSNTTPNTGASGGDGIDGVGGNADGTAGPGGNFLGGGGGGIGGDGIIASNGMGFANGFAGEFLGDVDVTGAITAGTKDFKIDNPLDPANKYLVHASVESSEMMNIYTGNVTTDSQGSATVQMPEWFEALNTDFRYQLTVIGQFAQAIIATKIQNNRFEIRTTAPDVEVSWQITGIRQDAFAKAHPLVVDQEKDARLRGYYIHPELYGAPEEKQIEWARHPQTMKTIKEMRAKQQGTIRADAQPAAAPQVGSR